MYCSGTKHVINNTRKVSEDAAQGHVQSEGHRAVSLRKTQRLCHNNKNGPHTREPSRIGCKEGLRTGQSRLMTTMMWSPTRNRVAPPHSSADPAAKHIRLRPNRTTVDSPAKHPSKGKPAVFCGGEARGFLRRRVKRLYRSSLLMNEALKGVMPYHSPSIFFASSISIIGMSSLIS